jgi:hypothetical protein
MEEEQDEQRNAFSSLLSFVTLPALFFSPFFYLNFF